MTYKPKRRNLGVKEDLQPLKKWKHPGGKFLTHLMNLVFKITDYNKFEQLVLQGQAACGDAYRLFLRNLTKANHALVASKPSIKPIYLEASFLATFSNELKQLAHKLPIEIEQNLVVFSKPLSTSNRDRVRELITDYFSRAKDDYLRGWHARRAAANRGNEQPAKSYLSRLDSVIADHRVHANDNLNAVFRRRQSYRRLEVRNLWLSIIVGVSVGIVGSFIATWLWWCLFDR